MREKLDIGQTLSKIFQTYQHQASVLLPGALVVFLPVAIINALIRSSAVRGSLVGVIFTLLAILIQLVAIYLFQGMVVQLVRDIQDGRRDSSMRQLFESAVPVLGTLILAGILAGIGITIGFILLIIPGLFLLTIWALIAPAIVVDRTGVGGAFGRSRELVRDNGWQVFAVLAILFVIQFVVTLVLTTLVVGISRSVIGAAAAQLIAYVLIAPLSALAAATMYFELRRIKEAAPAPAVGPAPGAPAPAGGTGAPEPAGGATGPATPGPAPESPTRPAEPPPASQPPPPAAG
ncbi:MAG TPA: hypothetical protein VHI73_04505 [Solirubrobacteraceae bacterium]|jgi:hypothetical protein|nr:hypothetical protein [Solirubrobacteraceae bacterium]